MLSRLAPVFAFISALVSLTACDPAVEEAAEVRSLEIGGWKVQAPVHLGEVASCEDYWDEVCGEWSATSCALQKARTTCSTVEEGGVVITDHFGDKPPVVGQEGWRVLNLRSKQFSAPAATPEDACLLLDEPETCLELAVAFEALPVLRTLAPQGGIAGLGASESLPADDLLVATLDPLNWSVPALPAKARAYLASIIVIEDVIMLIAPDGTATASSKDVVLIRDVRCSMDKVEVCVDVDVK